jgi:outer membrane protein
MEEFVARLEKRPDIVALLSQVEVAEKNIDVARNGYFPTVAFTGDYYALRTGPYQDVVWDFGLTLNWPIYSGGSVDSQIRQATSVARQAQLNLSQARRQGLRDIETAYKASASGMNLTIANKKLVEISERNFRELTREYRLGLAQNIDVLTALNSLVTGQRSYDTSRYQTAAAVDSLKAFSGQLPE